METQVTAKEFFKNWVCKEPRLVEGGDTTINLMIEFAKYHVQKCKEEIAEKARPQIKPVDPPSNGYEEEYFVSVDKQSILDAYNLDNIK